MRMNGLFLFVLLTLASKCSYPVCSTVYKVGISNPMETCDSILEARTMDTIYLEESALFNDSRYDTLSLVIEEFHYKIPIKIPVQIVSKNPNRYFYINGLKLRRSEHKDVRKYLQELFNKPAKYLSQILGSDWTQSNIYKDYFRKYDDKFNDSEEFQQNYDDFSFNVSATEDIVDNTKINFPLPATIDLEVDLRNNDKKLLRVLGLEFNYNKLDKDFRKWLTNFEPTDKESGVKTIIE